MKLRSRRALLLTAAALLVGGGAAAAHVAVAAVRLQDGLAEAREAASAAMDALARTDLTAAEAALQRMTAAAADAAPDDPIWRAAETVPVFGENLIAGRIAAQGLVRIGDDVATPMLDVAQALAPADPPAALAALQRAAVGLADADRARAEVAARLGAVPRGHLVSQVADGLSTLDEAVERLTPLTEGAAAASALLPAALGADGDRTILVVVQNPAELRSGGGITGSFIELAAVDGVVTLTAQRDSADFAPADEPILPLPAGEVTRFGDGLGRFVQNASMTTDFTLTARLASAWWESAGFAAPDVVLSVDPIVLAAVLGPLGPVDTASGPVGPDRLVDYLLVEPYLTLSPEEQTARFAEVAEAVVDALAAEGAGLPLAVALQRPIEEGRVSMWSRHAAEQRIVAGTPLAGPRARLERAGPDAFAVYFDDATGGKLTPYLDIALAVRTGVCRPDGLVEVEVVVEVASDLPEDAAQALPGSVTGGGQWGAAAGVIAPTMTVVAPPGWFDGGVRVDGDPVAAVRAADDERPTVTRRVDLRPGEARTLAFRFIGSEAADAHPALLHTPLLAPVEVGSGPLSCEPR